MNPSILIASLIFTQASADMKVQTSGQVLPATVRTAKPAALPPAVKTAVPLGAGVPGALYPSPPPFSTVNPAPARANANTNTNNNPSQALQQMMKAMGGAGANGGGANGAAGGGFPNGYQPRSVTADGSTSAPSGQNGFQYTTPGSVASCKDGALPPKVAAAYKQAQDFRNSCPAANKGDKQMIAINDYSCSGTPTMWIFDANGNCQKKTAITMGAGIDGAGKGPCPAACSTDGDHLTPPGFHLTAYHDQGEKYGPSNSMLLVGLEGQESGKRNILIHKAANPGTASSWGCSGVCYGCYDDIARTLGFGALVYNYFGDPPHTSPGCTNKAGSVHSPRCEVEAGAKFPAGAPETGDVGTQQ